MRRLVGGVSVILSVLVLGACGDDDDVQQAVEDVQEGAEDAVGGATARAAAEAMRAAIEARDLEPGQTARSVTVLQETSGDVPGDPTVSLIEDTDGDGNDDDGKVQLAVGDQEACVTVEDNGNTSVSGEAC